ncbi:MAG TPA: hypothetical protein ENK07_07650 [Bacteroidetes bacterium]|nr:hypothetical protein [Bacteroidota bacterium]
MGKDKRSRQKSRQKKLLKQRRKKQAGRRQKPGLSLSGILRRARSYPIHECRINRGWRESGLAIILVSRQRPDGLFVIASCVVDLYCLGVKDASVNPEATVMDYLDMAEDTEDVIPWELAHQIIYGAIDFAAKYGFKPHRDFRRHVIHVLEPREVVPPNPDLEFGKDGKPFYVADQYDDPVRIMRILEQTAGPGGYYFLRPVDEEDLSDMVFLDPDDLEFDEDEEDEF